MHAKRGNLTHGRYGSYIAEAALEKLLLNAAKCEKDAGFKYYCRAIMWQKASSSEVRPGLENLDDLTDDEYLECLHKVDLHFQKNSTLRENWRVEPFQGPQSLDERHSPKANYNAGYRKHKYYSKKVFEKQLVRVNGGRPLLPHQATERQFVEALKETSERMHCTHYIRHAARARFQFRGPQCMPHRDDLERFCFEPTPPTDDASRAAEMQDFRPASPAMFACVLSEMAPR